MPTPSLTREMIEAGVIDAMVARDAPTVRILSKTNEKRRCTTHWPQSPKKMCGCSAMAR